jgi:hypothetical protein
MPTRHALRDVVHPAYLRALIRRGLVLWLLCRIVVIVIALASRLGLLLTLSPVVVLLLALAVAFLAQEDARVMRERHFYANLGTASWWPAAVGGTVVLVLEGIGMLVAAAVAMAAAT